MMRASRRKVWRKLIAKLRQKRSPCSTGTFGARAFGIEGSASFTIHSFSAFATGLVDCATKRLKPSSVIVVTDCTLPLVSTVARPRSCSGTSFGTLSVRMPRMRQTSLATIHLRPPLANIWTDEGLMPAVLKATVVVVWIAVAAMMLLTFDDLGLLDDGRKLFTHYSHHLCRAEKPADKALRLNHDLSCHDSPAQVRPMFVVSESDAAAIRKAYVESGELSAVVELRRLFPGISDNENARRCVRTIAGSRCRPNPVKKPRACRTR
jgi:hypothetical protein